MNGLAGAGVSALLPEGGSGPHSSSNISSLTREGNPGQSNYSASKSGLDALTRTWALELAPHGVRVGGIAPGLVETPMLAGLAAADRDVMQQKVPLGRVGPAARDLARAEVHRRVRLLHGPRDQRGRRIDVVKNFLPQSHKVTEKSIPIFGHAIPTNARAQTTEVLRYRSKRNVAEQHAASCRWVGPRCGPTFEAGSNRNTNGGTTNGGSRFGSIQPRAPRCGAIDTLSSPLCDSVTLWPKKLRVLS